MTMKLPPLSKDKLTSPEILCDRLRILIGQEFKLTGATRTDGSNMRKTIEKALTNDLLPTPASKGSYQIVPPKGKGVPKLLLEFLDSYIITTGTTYNLQVWNRNPATDSVQIEYEHGEPLLSSDVRFVLTKVNGNTNTIESIVILTPEYIEKNFGRFGKPTIKHQLLISNKEREKLFAQHPPILFHPDAPSMIRKVSESVNVTGYSIHSKPEDGKILSLERIKDIIEKQLIGSHLDQLATKNRGQALETIISELLGYNMDTKDSLAGGYPDIRHQALEVKVQDSPTVDLGKYSPQFEEEIDSLNGFNTTTVRYLIALPDATGVIKGAVICPGYRLGEHFTYVSDTSFKCQRSIPMTFFEQFKGKVVFNP
jgi:hypothetical protein